MARETQQCVAAEMAETGRQVGGDEERAAVVCPPHDYAYEAQFFRFTPETCMMRIVDAFQESLNGILLAVEGVLVRQKLNNNNTELRAADGSEEERLRRTKECSQKLKQYLQKRFQRMESKMKTLLTNNCFTIPTNVLLPEDEPHRKYPQHLQEALRLESSIAELHRAYEAEVCGRRALLAELEEQKETQELLDGILKWMEETTEMTKEDRTTGRFQGSIQQLLDHCLAPDTSGDGTGCDNMTSMIVTFRPHPSAAPSQSDDNRKRKQEDAAIEPEANGNGKKKAKCD